jgi:cell division septum initiation protein DivIVA
MTNRRERIAFLMDTVEGGATADKEMLQELLSIITDCICDVEVALVENQKLKQENRQLQSELENYQDVAFHKGRLQ